MPHFLSIATVAHGRAYGRQRRRMTEHYGLVRRTWRANLVSEKKLCAAVRRSMAQRLGRTGCGGKRVTCRDQTGRACGWSFVTPPPVASVTTSGGTKCDENETKRCKMWLSLSFTMHRIARGCVRTAPRTEVRRARPEFRSPYLELRKAERHSCILSHRGGLIYEPLTH